MDIDDVLDELLKELKLAGNPKDAILWVQAIHDLTQAYCLTPQLFTTTFEDKETKE
jgi:hypothetical protein